MKRKYFLCVLALTVLLLGGCARQQSQMDDTGADKANQANLEASGQTAETAPAPSDPASGNAADAGTGILTADEAKAKALAHAGLSDSQVTVVKCKLDNEKGRQVYDVEFYTADRGEYDYEIDASTGEIVQFDYEAEGYTLSASPSGGSALSEDEAKALALAQVPGATAGDIRKFEADYEDGRMEFEGKIVYDGMEYEFEIDAYSGVFRSWKAEPVGR